METLEELKAIVDNAPSGCAGITSEGQYFLNSDFVTVDNGFIDIDGADEYSGDFESFEFRSLSDIKRIIELMELNQGMHTTVAGYLYGKDWAHWNEFNAGKFKL